MLVEIPVGPAASGTRPWPHWVTEWWTGTSTHCLCITCHFYNSLDEHVYITFETETCMSWPDMI